MHQNELVHSTEVEPLHEDYSQQICEAALKKVDRLAIAALSLFFILFSITAYLASFLFEPVSDLDGFYKLIASIGVAIGFSIPGFVIGRLSGAGSGWHEISLIYRKRGLLYHSAKDIA